MKKIKASEEVQQISLLMGDMILVSQQKKLVKLVFVILFGVKQEDSLNFLRYVKFMEMVSNKAIDPQKFS